MGVFDWIRLIAGSAFLACGLVIFFTEVFGAFHFHYVLNRMHVAAMGDTLGIASCLTGLIIFSGINFTSMKLLLIIVFLWLASPVSSHVLARLEVATNENLESYCEVYTDIESLEADLVAEAKAGEAKAETESRETAADAESEKTAAETESGETMTDTEAKGGAS